MTHERKKYLFANIVYEAQLKNLDFKPSDECVSIDYFTPEQVFDIDYFINVKKLAEQFIDSKNP